MFGAARGPGLLEQAERIAAATRGEEAGQSLAKAAAKAEAKPACDAKTLAKAKAKTKAEADEDLAALAEGLAKNQAELAMIKALGADRAYTGRVYAGAINRTAAAGEPTKTCVTS